MNRLTFINIKIFISILLVIGFVALTQAQKKNEKFVLVLDAGHGGKDTGTRGVVKNEKEIALSITLKLGNLIKNYFKDDVKLIYTRTSDKFITLSGRANIANRNHADLFVSIHCNAAPRKSAKGTETFVLGTEKKRSDVNFDVVKRENSVILLEDDYKETYEGFDPKSPESVIGLTLMQNLHLENSLRFAKSVEDYFVNKDKRFSRGVKQHGFLVLVRTATPSVLIETGFISNKEEGKYLSTKKGQDATAESIFLAFVDYKKEWDIKRGIYKEEKKQKPKPKPKPVPKPEPEKAVEGKLFKIQFLTSKKEYRKNAIQLKGLSPVEIIKDKGLYKYFYGNTSYISKRDEMLKKVRMSGFPDAFVVEYDISKPKKNNENIVAVNTGFRVQILASQRNYSKNAPQMKGVKNIEKVKSGKLYIYYSGWFKTEKEAESAKNNINRKGFSDAYVVKFVNGKKQ